MKRIVVIFLLFSLLNCYAQNRSSIETQYLSKLITTKGTTITRSGEWLKKNLAIDETQNGTIVRVLAKVSNDFDASQFEGIVIGSRIANIVTMQVPVEKLPLLEQSPSIKYYEIARKVAPTLDNVRFDTHTDSVQSGIDLPQGFDGEGVLIGVTDWGFDYTNISFNNVTEDNHRIVRAWDQFKTSGPAPTGFNYGTEFVGYDQLIAAQGDTSGLYGYATHATHVSGIAAGRGTLNGTYRGQAPNANLLMASFLLDEASWIDAVSWMKQVSEIENKRLVINSSWGMYTFSNLDGTSLLSQAIDGYADQGVVFVTSGGNNGDVRFHISYDFLYGKEDTLKTIVNYYSSGIGEALILWGEEGKDFEAALGIYEGNELHMTDFYATNRPGSDLDSFLVVGEDTIRFNLMWEHANFNNGQPHILFNVDKVKSYTPSLFITADSGIVHAWNVCNLENHAGNMGAEFTKGNRAGYSNGDRLYGVGEPGCAAKTITVAAHHADRLNTATGRLMPGNIAEFSSNGPLTSGVKKPEISAPGVQVVSSISSFTEESYTPKTKNYYDGRWYIFAEMSGTSMSSPAVTGIVALVLQANPNLSVDEVRDILFTTARNDNLTGNIIATQRMSDTWGWGKVDAYRAVVEALDRASIDNPDAKTMPISVYPNPATHSAIVLTGTDRPSPLSIYSVSGQKMWEGTASAQTEIDLTPFSNGIYIIRLQNGSTAKTAKLVVAK